MNSFLRMCNLFLLFLLLFLVSACGGSGGSDEMAEQGSPARIIFFGDSLTSGYRLSAEKAYPAIIQTRLDAGGFNYITENYSVVGDTSTDGFNRIDGIQGSAIDIFVLALGVNDAEDGIAAAEVEVQLQAIIDAVLDTAPDAEIIIAGVDLPALMTNEQRSSYAAMYARLAADNGAQLLPDLLAGVAGRPEFILADGIHPNTAGHERIADNVWEVLVSLLS